MVTKILVVLVLCALASCKIYNINLKCGTCQSTSGCTANLCFTFSGDLTAEYCANTSSCSFSFQESLQIGTCTTDLSGKTCASGVCMGGGSVNMCFSTSGYGCLDGVVFQQTCSGSTMTITEYGGILGSTPITTTLSLSSLGQSCFFSSATGRYSTCSTDSTGSNCGCCFSMTFTGLSAMTGGCVSSTSGIASIKAKLSSSSSFQIHSLLQILLLLALMIV